MNNTLRVLCAILLIVFFISGCMPSPYYQKEEGIPKNEWSYNFRPKFVFEITDTQSVYQPQFIIQHTQAYPYCNIWLWAYIKTPGDTIPKKERINITLAEASGKWLGRGMGEIWEQRVMLNFGDSISFNKKGTYEISLEQNMRVDPLPNIMHVGLRIEKVGHR